MVGQAATLQEIMQMQDRIEMLQRENAELKNQIKALTTQVADAAKNDAKTEVQKERGTAASSAALQEINTLKERIGGLEKELMETKAKNSVSVV